MNHLVIEQGTLIDRIDYNLQEAEIHVDKGRKQLQKVRYKCFLF
jgi:t-SNARE complex subunit, syntaxin